MLALSHSLDYSQQAPMRKAAPKGDILVVDDTPDNLRVLSFMLEKQGYKVRTALSGQLALRAIRAFPPDLVLLDIRLQGMDGYEVCRILKSSSQTSLIPIIFLSALTEVTDKLKAFEVGGVDYITKPFQVEEVLVRVENQFTIRHLQTQLIELNLNLERQVQERTAQLKEALDFEGILRRITDRLRDSLDEDKILQVAVQELASNLNILGCDIAFYDLKSGTSKIWNEHICSSLPNAEGTSVRMSLLPEVYSQLLQGKVAVFCSTTLKLPVVRGNDTNLAVLACPLINDQGVLGDMWIFRSNEESFTDSEVRLVQQVTNHCAIALRQARLYQASQLQIKDLERLNCLKDDFLSTISHELRTPISNIKLATQMLEIILEPMGILEDEESRAACYFKILQDESQREIELITDLLDLTRLDAGTDPLSLITIDPGMWLSHAIEPFLLRTQARQQTLQVKTAVQLPMITTDLGYLERLVTELLNNACKYTPSGGNIIVLIQALESVESSTVASPAFLSFSLPDAPIAAVQIRVCNTGAEIPPLELAHIFDKFYRVPNSDPWKHGGTGLGLALVKKLADRLNATISATSDREQTSFVLDLPIQCAGS